VERDGAHEDLQCVLGLDEVRALILLAFSAEIVSPKNPARSSVTAVSSFGGFQTPALKQAQSKRHRPASEILHKMRRPCSAE
jgi:hypothetical protein